MSGAAGYAGIVLVVLMVGALVAFWLWFAWNLWLWSYSPGFHSDDDVRARILAWEDRRWHRKHPAAPPPPAHKGEQP